MLAACEPVIIPETKKDVAFYFGEATAQTTENSATITAEEPYMTIDGEKYDEAKVYLEYIYHDELGAEESTPFRIYNYEAKDGNLIFTIENLTAETKYVANIVVDGGEYGTERSEAFTFTTQKHTPVTEVNYSVEVEAKGLMATVNLSDIAYLVDGATEQISIIKVEYSPASTEGWLSHEFYGSMIESGTMSVELPFEGEDYLKESSDYKLRVTLFPENSNYAPLRSDEHTFSTIAAEVSVNIPMPTLSINAHTIDAKVENIEIFYDGVPSVYYNSPYSTRYQFRYREKGTTEWSVVEVGAKYGAINATLPLGNDCEGKSFEVQAIIYAGADAALFASDIAEIEVPVSTPPTPPIGGGGDTSDIAGTWCLTQWRGTEPSFDVYLSITENGIVTLWQRIESREWQRYYSTAVIENGVISGTYTDGVAWGASYNVTLGNETMTWVNTADSGDISVYTRAELPEGFTPAQSATRTTNRVRFL